MASLTAAASTFVAGGRIADRPSMSRRRSGAAAAVVAARARPQEAASPAASDARAAGGGNGGRRAAVLAAAAAAAACALGPGIATAREEPKPGTPEAKKLYAPVCVTMPTAKICHK